MVNLRIEKKILLRYMELKHGFLELTIVYLQGFGMNKIVMAIYKTSKNQV
jgi:hypothetical protein